jgi:hypothetical protein
VKLKLIEGTPITLTCAGCQSTGIGGTNPYVGASSGEFRAPEQWYAEADKIEPVYCSACAAKLTEQDPTRSVSQFYSDTDGTIKPENLPDL